MAIKASTTITLVRVNDGAGLDFIVGTQTAATGSWTGVASFAELHDGQQITYWLPYAGVGSATLNLTLSDGSTTGAIPCYYGGKTRLTTHYPAGSAIRLIYRVNANISDASYTGWWADANYDSNTYDRIRFNNAITAKSAISASRIIVGDSSGFFHLGVEAAFDTDKPILYAVSAIASGATGSNNYLSYPSVTLRNNLSDFSGTNKKTCYIVGTLDGIKFTPNSTLFTTEKPTSDNGLVYISLGLMVSAYQIYLYPEHPMYRYINGAFKNFAQIAYEAQDNIDNLEIGGRNLLLKSDKIFFNGSDTSNGGKCVNTNGEIIINPTNDGNIYTLNNHTSKELIKGKTYTFSFESISPDNIGFYWYPSESYTKNKYIPISDKWVKNVFTYIQTGNDALGTTNKLIGLNGLIAGHTYKIRNIKLEEGDKATDWAPAPEDFDEKIDETEKQLNQNIDDTKVQITTAYNKAIEELEKSITIMIEKVEGATSSNSDMITFISNKIDLTVEDINLVKTTTEILQDLVDGKMDAKEIREWARFDGASLELGASNSPFKAILTNTELGFYQGTNKVAWLSNNELHILTAIVTSAIGIGNYRFVDEGDLGFSLMLAA